MDTLEEHQSQVQSMASSRYIDSVFKEDNLKAGVTFRQEITLWQRKLVSMSETLFSLAEIQKAWAYLEPLFIGMCVCFCVCICIHMYICVCVYARNFAVAAQISIDV